MIELEVKGDLPTFTIFVWVGGADCTALSCLMFTTLVLLLVLVCLPLSSLTSSESIYRAQEENPLKNVVGIETVSFFSMIFFSSQLDITCLTSDTRGWNGSY